MSSSTTTTIDIDRDKWVTFFLAVGSDFALVPSLYVTARNRKHFEVFVGFSAICTGFLYNACDALDVSLFLTKDEWHKINNVMAITYCALLAVYLMCNSSNDWNTLLRYNAFGCVTIAQVRDGFWMERSQWSLLVITFYAMLPIVKFLRLRQIPAYRRKKTKRGLLCAFAAAIFFAMGLDENNDPFRLWHSVAHVFMGLTLYHLWGIAPSVDGRHGRRKRKNDRIVDRKSSSYDFQQNEDDDDDAGGWRPRRPRVTSWA